MALLDLPLRAWAKRIRRDALTLWLAARHPDTPWPAKLLAGVVVAYALSPIDLIPDFVPVLGLLDDLLLLPALIWLAVRLVPADVLAACRAEAEQRMALSL
ncbi:MAG: YkvA family protein, partial [Leptothrix sp. (in: b-proteobacteria)]